MVLVQADAVGTGLRQQRVGEFESLSSDSDWSISDEDAAVSKSAKDKAENRETGALSDQ